MTWEKDFCRTPRVPRLNIPGSATSVPRGYVTNHGTKALPAADVEAEAIESIGRGARIRTPMRRSRVYMRPLILKQINKLGRQIAADCGRIRKARARKMCGDFSSDKD